MWSTEVVLIKSKHKHRHMLLHEDEYESHHHEKLRLALHLAFIPKREKPPLGCKTILQSKLSTK